MQSQYFINMISVYKYNIYIVFKTVHTSFIINVNSMTRDCFK